MLLHRYCGCDGYTGRFAPAANGANRITRCVTFSLTTLTKCSIRRLVRSSAATVTHTSNVSNLMSPQWNG